MANYNPTGRAPSVKEKGLDNHLNSTRDKHNGLGAKEFHALRASGVNKANLARAFHVDGHTIRHWLKIDDEEQAKR